LHELRACLSQGKAGTRSRSRISNQRKKTHGSASIHHDGCRGADRRQLGCWSLGAGSPAPARTTLRRQDRPHDKGLRKGLPKMVEAPKGAPNILLILTDDVGFGASSTFGDRSPRRRWTGWRRTDFRYNNFHTRLFARPRAPHCSADATITAPTRASSWNWHGLPRLRLADVEEQRDLRRNPEAERLHTSWYGKNHNVPTGRTARPGVRPVADRVGL